jgi:hypothetical protein
MGAGFRRGAAARAAEGLPALTFMRLRQVAPSGKFA